MQQGSCGRDRGGGRVFVLPTDVECIDPVTILDRYIHDHRDKKRDISIFGNGRNVKMGCLPRFLNAKYRFFKAFSGESFCVGPYVSRRWRIIYLKALVKLFYESYRTS